MVEFNSVLFRELCRRVEETDDPKELVELSDEIVRLINDKRRRISVAKRVLKVVEGVRPITELFQPVRRPRVFKLHAKSRAL